MTSSSSQVGDFTVFVPPRGLNIEIHSVIDALEFAVESDRFGPYGVLVAWLDLDRRLVGCAATDHTTASVATVVPLIELGGAIGAGAAIVFSPVSSGRARQVREDDLRLGRAFAEASSVRLLDWIMIGPDDLRSMAVTAGWAPPWWDRDPPLEPT